MSRIWKSLHFTQNPYSELPLSASDSSIDLLVGRTSESDLLYSMLDSGNNGVITIGGEPGVGKTSFFNVNQHLLESGRTEVGPRLLSSQAPCAIASEDTTRDIAFKVVVSLINSIEAYCNRTKSPLPPQVKKLGQWAKSRGTSSLEIGFQVLGVGLNFGRSISLPPVSDATFDSLRDAIEVLSFLVTEKLQLEGSVIVLDNVENLSRDALRSVLFTFRDTLFIVPNVWWTLIGQKGLGGIVQMFGPRIADRIGGNSIELEPLSFPDLEDAISRRIAKYSEAPLAKAPLAQEIHQELYDASQRDIRFVFMYCTKIVRTYTQYMRSRISSNVSSKGLRLDDDVVLQVARSYFKERQIPLDEARQILREDVRTDIAGLKLKREDADLILSKTAGLSAHESAHFSMIASAPSEAEILNRLHEQGLLSHRQDSSLSKYFLRGILALAILYSIPLGELITNQGWD
jgi:Cdc6-like AAA superfamily ATPase